MPTTLYNIIHNTHPLLDIPKLCQEIGIDEPELRKLSITGFKDNTELRNKVASILSRYVMIEKDKHIHPLSPDDLTNYARTPLTIANQVDISITHGENFVSRNKMASYKHSLNKKIERWRKLIVATLIEQDLLNTTDLSKSAIIIEYGFAPSRIEKLLATSDLKSRADTRDDIYVLLLLSQVVGLKLEISHE
jgi:hypothetical protein